MFKFLDVDADHKAKTVPQRSLRTAELKMNY